MSSQETAPSAVLSSSLHPNFPPLASLAMLPCDTPLAVFSFLCSFFCVLELHLRHMEAPRLGVKSELQLPVYTTAPATQDPSCLCDLHHSSQQRRILNLSREARESNPRPHGFVGFVTAEPQGELQCTPWCGLTLLPCLIFTFPPSLPWDCTSPIEHAPG